MNIIGIDLGKNQMEICVMTERGKVLKRVSSKRKRLVVDVLNLGKGLIAMETCGGSNYWGRVFEELGYKVRRIPGQFVKPFVKSNKNDKNDAEAICEAASRKNMRYVSVKSESQQDVQSIHRIRERLVSEKTALINEIRGLLLEYGITISQGISNVRQALPSIIEDNSDKSELWKSTFLDLYSELISLEKRAQKYTKLIKNLANANQTSKRLLKIPGIGEITASALASKVNKPGDFKNGREFAAWLGLVPRQNSTGGKTKLSSISKRGDRYIRRLLVQGACSYYIATKKKIVKEEKLSRTERWFMTKVNNNGFQKAMIAMANKNARFAWKVLMGNEFRHYEQIKPQKLFKLPIAA